jgi:hypothetical protein
MSKKCLIVPQTEIGYARAWIRLALERKMLSHFLHVLLNDTVQLSTLYKRYAFLRSEEEREQVRAGTWVLIFKIFLPKNSAKKMAFFIQNKAKLCKKLIITFF